jgi:hypothetical protein
MTSLPRCAFSSLEPQRPFLGSVKSKNSNIKNRHYSSTNKFIKTLLLTDSKSQKVIDKDYCTEALEGAQDKKELRRYCINRFRTAIPQ